MGHLQSREGIRFRKILERSVGNLGSSDLLSGTPVVQRRNSFPEDIIVECR